MAAKYDLVTRTAKPQMLSPLGDHDLRAVLSGADGGDGTKVRAQKGRYLFFLEFEIPW